MIPEVAVPQRERLCACGRRLAWWHATDARCCRCMRIPDGCQCPATSDPAVGCLSLELADLREPDGEDPKVRVSGQRPIYACPYCGHHRQQHAPQWDGQDCWWICSMVEPAGPCLCSVLCLEDCGQRHEHGWIDLEEADSEVDA